MAKHRLQMQNSTMVGGAERLGIDHTARRHKPQAVRRKNGIRLEQFRTRYGTLLRRQAKASGLRQDKPPDRPRNRTV